MTSLHSKVMVVVSSVCKDTLPNQSRTRSGAAFFWRPDRRPVASQRVIERAHRPACLPTCAREAVIDKALSRGVIGILFFFVFWVQGSSLLSAGDRAHLVACALMCAHMLCDVIHGLRSSLYVSDDVTTVTPPAKKKRKPKKRELLAAYVLDEFLKELVAQTLTHAAN